MKFSHFASLESGEVLKAATEDLVRIFQLEVPNPELFGGGRRGEVIDSFLRPSRIRRLKYEIIRSESFVLFCQGRVGKMAA